jgi:hypothetical protein
MLGMQPATEAEANSVQAGASQRAQSSSTPIAATVIPVARRITLAWPKRSTSRDTCGPSAAADRARVAETAPASP